MTENKTLSKIQAIFREVLDDNKIVLTLETTANDIEYWDSVTHIGIIVAVEDEYQIKFSLGELQSLNNVGDFCTLINSKTT